MPTTNIAQAAIDNTSQNIAGPVTYNPMTAANQSTNTSINAAAPAVAGTAVGDGYTATDMAKPDALTVNKDSTVASQVAGTINSNSPLMQQANARAMD